jgi:asparagine synthase (glutamine-hydrolysing)
MCGIFSIINNTITKEDVFKNAFNNGKNRGPEFSVINYGDINNKTVFGFHRLAINGFNDELSDQPFYLKNCSLICNGEIYNYKELYKKCEFENISRSDCEIIIHLYKKYGIEHTLQLIDGVFAFVLFDYEKNEIFFARDTYGVRPMFYYYDDDHQYIFASEMKQIISLIKPNTTIQQFNPGTYTKFIFGDDDFYKPEIVNKYFSTTNVFYNKNIINETMALKSIRTSLENAVEKRVKNTDRDIACLLSGGLDSSLIASLVKKYHKKYYPMKKLHTWSIGIKGSEDLKYAKIVAKHINSQHHSIEVEKEDLLNIIEQVIYNIESYDTTTVRASIPNYLISKYIKNYENICDAKVIFNGDGSDEVSGGYLYFHYIDDPYEFDKECRRLLDNIHYFDVLRSDRTISSNGLEARTPFLDRGFVQNYLSIPPEYRCHTSNNLCEKFLIRKAFDDDITLPKKVLWRTKEAFSDGVSGQTNSWYKVIQSYIKETIFVDDNYPKDESELINMMIKELKLEHNLPTTLEQLYYRILYQKNFENQHNVIPYFWMPTYGNTKDASARTLDIYKKLN